MSGSDRTRFLVCPRCGCQYHGRPALSRKDNKTSICPDCGTREALDSVGIGAEEQAQIIDEIHKTYKA